MTLHQTAAELREAGLTFDQIAQQIDRPKRKVYELLRYADRKRRRQPVQVPVETLEVLREHAEARNVSVTVLARDLLVAAARDDIVNAVLDDGAESQRTR